MQSSDRIPIKKDRKTNTGAASIMRKGFRLSLLVIVLTLGFLAGCTLVDSIQPKSSKSIETVTPTPDAQETIEIQQVERAVEEALKGRQDVLAFLIYKYKFDRVVFSDDRNLAVAWISFADPNTNKPVEGEPALAIARRQDGNQGWKVTLQADADWATQLGLVPDTLISQEVKNQFTPGNQTQPKDHVVYSGYRLPWKAGEARRVTGSIGHVLVYKSCPTTCLYAFDFADGTHFPVMAAKGGKVKMAVWKYPNDNHDNANYLLLEDDTTTPTTYQIYYHLEYDSIPAALRVPGAAVVQGQFIGNADNTGPSTGSHLHFMVHTNSSSYWGTSVDITFDDVTTNGGRPRTCSEAQAYPGYGSQCQTNNLYTSGNGDNEFPTGGISDPKVDTVVTSPTLSVSGWGKDDTGVASVQLMITSDGTWQPIGLPQTEASFTTQVDLCQANIPDGDFFLSVKVTDTAGKTSQGVTGLTHLTKKYDCNPAPKDCDPESGQIAIFSEANFSGDCELLAAGDYTQPDQFGSVGANNLESVKIGAGTFAWMYDEPGFADTPETFLVSDYTLADNLVGANRVSSIKVRLLPALPAEPTLETPVNASGMSPTDQDTLALVWHNPNASNESAEFAPEYRSVLTGPDGTDQTLDWQSGLTWQVGPLSQGKYTWVVYARNISGYSQSSLQFSVEKADALPVTQMKSLPETSNGNIIHLQWLVEQGENDMKMFEIQYRTDGANWIDWDHTAPAYSREAWFVAQNGLKYEFRMRGVDVAGQTEAYPENAETVTTVEAACTPDSYDGTQNLDDLSTSPTALEIGESQEHNLCGAGDEDWVMFPAKTGQSLHISTEPVAGNAAVVIQLYSHDGTELGEQWPATYNQSAALDWTAPEDGIYFLRLSGIDEKMAGTDVSYQIKVDKTGQIATGGLFCSGLALPALWLAVKLYMKRKQSASGEE
jgi:murein DD-endopeptidase MepM/ murein hydrolase activator NlpD